MMILNRIKAHFNQNPLIWKLVLGSFLFFLIQKLTWHYFFHSTYYDMFFYDKTCFEVAMGRGMFINGVYRGPLAFLVHEGNHFMPFLVPIGWLYKLWPSAFWLFLFASICNVLVIYPTLKIAKHHFGRKGVWLAFWMMMLYLPFRLTNLVDNFGEIFMAPLVAWTLYWLILNRPKRAIITALISLFAKESGAILPASLGLYFIVKNRKWVQGTSLIGMSLVSIFLTTKLLIPEFCYFNYFHVNRNFGYLGESIQDKLQTLVFQPKIWLSVLFRGDKIGYFAYLFFPFALIPLFSPYLLVVSGYLVQNFLSKNFHAADMYYHFTLPIYPALFIATITQAAIFSRKLPAKVWDRWLKIGKGLFITVAVIGVFHFFLIEGRTFFPHLPIQETYKGLSLVPESANVSCSTVLGAHLNRHKTITVFPKITAETDYVAVVDLDPFWPATNNHTDFLKSQWKTNKWDVIKALFRGERNFAPEGRKKYAKDLEAIKHNSEFEVLYYEPGAIYVFKRIPQD